MILTEKFEAEESKIDSFLLVILCNSAVYNPVLLCYNESKDKGMT